MKRYFYILFTTVVITTIASADYITISAGNGNYDLQAREVSGILEDTNHQFALSEQEILAETLKNDGIETIGKLSFVLTNTDAGLSFVGLFDGLENTDPTNSVSDQFLGLTATTSIDSDWFATGDTGSEIGWHDMGNGTQMVSALLAWDHELTSAGFAWGDVTVAQTGTVNLYDVDLTEFASNSIQFITYQDDQWQVAGTSDFSVLGQYAFSYQFVPAPGAIALLSIAALAGPRRRRK
tara:strand:- start:152 stop:865 length:714 start_codon:yes stop_codon:yes gene_type:complete